MAVRRSHLISVLLLLVGSAPASGQDWEDQFGIVEFSEKIPVELDHYGDDTVGRRFAYTLREEIRRSTRYFLADHGPITVEVYTMEAVGDVLAVGDILAAVSVVIGQRDIWWAYKEDGSLVGYYDSEPKVKWHQLSVVGKNRADDQARNLMVDLDEIVSGLLMAAEQIVSMNPANCDFGLEEYFRQRACKLADH
jgi:hypothetical protein